MLSKSLQKRNKILSLKLKSKILKTAFKKKKRPPWWLTIDS